MAFSLVPMYSIPREVFRRVVNFPSRSGKYVSVSLVPPPFDYFACMSVFFFLFRICDYANVFNDIKTE